MFVVVVNRSKRMKIDNLGAALEDAVKENPQWRKTSKEGLDLDYCLLLCKSVADELFTKLEDTVQYYDGDLTKVTDSLFTYCAFSCSKL